jgi:hypothetical protein
MLDPYQPLGKGSLTGGPAKLADGMKATHNAQPALVPPPQRLITSTRKPAEDTLKGVEIESWLIGIIRLLGTSTTSSNVSRRLSTAQWLHPKAQRVVLIHKRHRFDLISQIPSQPIIIKSISSVN